MQSDRWKQIDQLLDAALELEPDKRSSFLEQNCPADEELRKEVEELLASDEKAQGFIETPAYQGAAELLSTPLARLSASQLLASGRYQILNSLGSGGMGEVYRAKDLRLGREVAIKVLPERMAKDREASQRFEREATALAALSHPNVLSIFDVGTDQGGTSYVVMELLQGETLRTRLQNGPLPWPMAVEIGISIQEGLWAAHSKGVIHRDLKPENIFVTSEGIVKILDFGLALFDWMLSPEELTTAPALLTRTTPGLIMGTVAYMSPEQLRAERLDARSDLFSFGCILYEMLNGKRPFTGNGPAETIASILKDEPVPISERVKDLPPGLNEILQRCLKKTPEDRFQSAPDVAFGLRKVLDRSAVQITSRKPFRFNSPRMIWATSILFFLLAAAFIVTFQLHSGGTRSLTISPSRNISKDPDLKSLNDGKPKTIAILPFRPLVAAARDEALELGMADTLITRLGNTRSITVRPLNSVRNFNSADRDPLKAGKALEVESVLEGTLQHSKDRIRVNVRMIRVRDGATIWAGTFDEKFTDIFVVQDAIAARIAGALALQLSSDERTRLEKHYTSSPEAYEFYLRGRYHSYKLFEDSLRQGIGFYELAITADPNYALAYAEMADAHRRLGITGFARPKEVFLQAKVLAKKALELDESLAEAYLALGWIDFLYEWDWSAAEVKLKRAIELSPNNSDVHLAYAHVLSCAGRHEEAVAEGRLARELSPATLIVLAIESQFLLFAGREDEAIRQAKKALEFDPNFWVALNQLGRSYSFQKRYTEAIDELLKAKQLAPGSPEPSMQLGYAFGAMDNHKKAYEVLEEMKRRSNERFVPLYSFAMVYNGLGNREKALDLLERSVDERETQLAFLQVDVRWDNLRSDPRFVNMLRKMNLEVSN